MGDHKKFQGHIDEVAKLISEYNLSEAELEVDDFKIVLRRQRPPVMVGTPAPQQFIEQAVEAAPIAPVAAPVQAGTPISSPMMGIYYASSSPSADPYVREGDTVTAGQVIGLIEAMKVFNEIQSSVSGTVKKIVAEGGDIVNPGDPLMYIG
ncbi:MAG: acetyl-CoA carboxylase biotin carboxyl carrier protein subunit [Fimbriimonas sp.]|jgi:acetyl-CoA carboxylase biotin carboxyl carrier protein|nr:acetyl-CoA carboxylase biotin carboxyl carrier protein subunit [Fimbriimonas sp.]